MNKLRHPDAQRLLERTIREILKNPGAVVVDVGAGHVLEKQAPFGDHYARLAALPGYISFDVQPHERPTIVGDAHALPFKDASVDAVFLTSVLEHLTNPNRAIDEVCRVLRPGGRLFGYAPFYHHYHPSPSDYFRFTEMGIKHLTRDFRTVEIVSGGNYVAALSDVLMVPLWRIFGSTRLFRAVQFIVQLPLKALFHLIDRRLPPTIAAGFAFCAQK
jgi:SAM-dependent methyltransferase